MQHKIVPPKKTAKYNIQISHLLEPRWPLKNDVLVVGKNNNIRSLSEACFWAFTNSFSRVSLNISTHVTRNFSEKRNLCTIKPAADLHPKHLSPTVLEGNRLEQPQQSPITSTTKAQKYNTCLKMLHAAIQRCNYIVTTFILYHPWSSFWLLLDLHDLLKSPRVSFTKHVSSVPKSLTFHAILVGSLKNSS